VVAYKLFVGYAAITVFIAAQDVTCHELCLLWVEPEDSLECIEELLFTEFAVAVRVVGYQLFFDAQVNGVRQMEICEIVFWNPTGKG
jgi:hypothetical protein